MTYKELYEKVSSGEWVLPITVQIKKPLWDEFELDTGCRAELIGIRESKDVGEYQVFFNFQKFFEYNKTFWDKNYYDASGNPTLAIYETRWFDKLGMKCDCFVSGEYDVEFTIVTNSQKNFTGLQMSDVIMTNVRLDEFTSEDKDCYIIALTEKLKALHAAICVLEKDEHMAPLGEHLRKILYK